MKKSLLLMSFVAVAGMAGAQTIVGLATSDDLAAVGLSGDKTTMPGGTVILDNEAGSFELAYEDSWGSTTTYKNYQEVKVGDSDVIKLGSGAVGNSNPTFISYESGVMSAGAVFKFVAKKDGYMTVFTKINPDKQYVVFEGKTGALPYTLGVAGADFKINYSLPAQTSGNDEGLIDFSSADASKYFIVATKQSRNEAGVLLWQNKVTGEVVAAEKNPTVKDDPDQQYAGVMEEVPGENKPEKPWLVANNFNPGTFASKPGESTGFLTFHVWAEMDYYFSALGSKAACGGFVFTESESEPAVTFCAVEDAEDPTKNLPEVVFATGAGVEDIAAEAADANAPIYNLMGVRVNADAKGILIQNGKKFIRK